MKKQFNEAMFLGDYSSRMTVDDIVRKWYNPYVAVVEKKKKKEGKTFSITDKITLAMCLENTERHFKSMNEATLSVKVGNYQRHGFSLITAILPNLISNDILVTEPMPKRKADLYFMKFIYGSNKGLVSSGSTMFSHDFVGNDAHDYTLEGIYANQVATGNGTVGAYAGSLNITDIVPGTVKFYTGTNPSQETFTDDGASNLVGSAGGSGTVNYSTGAFTITFGGVVPIGTAILADARLDFETNPDQIGSVEIEITSEAVEAEKRKMITKYSLDAVMELETAYGKSAENELKVALAAECRKEIDTKNLLQLKNEAGLSGTTWGITPPANVAWELHKYSIVDQLFIPMANDIQKATRRRAGNFAVAGYDVCNVLESLNKDYFDSAGQEKDGPHYLGMLKNKWKVYKNPAYRDDEVLLGYKGSNFLESGAIFGTHIPLMTTPVVMLEDFMARFGLYESSILKVFIPNFYNVGSIY